MIDKQILKDWHYDIVSYIVKLEKIDNLTAAMIDVKNGCGEADERLQRMEILAEISRDSISDLSDKLNELELKIAQETKSIEE